MTVPVPPALTSGCPTPGAPPASLCPSGSRAGALFSADRRRQQALCQSPLLPQGGVTFIAVSRTKLSLAQSPGEPRTCRCWVWARAAAPRPPPPRLEKRGPLSAPGVPRSLPVLPPRPAGHLHGLTGSSEGQSVCASLSWIPRAERPHTAGGRQGNREGVKSRPLGGYPAGPRPEGQPAGAQLPCWRGAG